MKFSKFLFMLLIIMGWGMGEGGMKDQQKYGLWIDYEIPRVLHMPYERLLLFYWNSLNLDHMNCLKEYCQWYPKYCISMTRSFYFLNLNFYLTLNIFWKFTNIQTEKVDNKKSTRKKNIILRDHWQPYFYS